MGGNKIVNFINKKYIFNFEEIIYMQRKIALAFSLSLIAGIACAAGSAPYSSFPHITVTTSPILHSVSARDGSDLIVNYPSASEQLTLLLQKQKLTQDMVAST